MKKTRLLVTLLFALTLLAVPYRAFAFFGVDAAVGAWQQSPSGKLSYNPVSGVTTDDLDLKNSLHFDTETRMTARIKAELPLILPNLYFMATPMSFEGSGMTTNFHFGNQTFDTTAPITTKLKLDHYDLALFYPVPLLKTATLGKLNAELGLNVRKIDFEVSISGHTAGGTRTESKDLSLYVPMIYAGIQVKPISLFSVEAELRWLGYGDNHYYDYLGRVRVNPIPVLFIAGGYRAEGIKIDASDVKTSIKFSGPFLEAGVSF
jgi:outer membrane protein